MECTYIYLISYWNNTHFMVTWTDACYVYKNWNSNYCDGICYSMSSLLWWLQYVANSSYTFIIDKSCAIEFMIAYVTYRWNIVKIFNTVSFLLSLMFTTCQNNLWKQTTGHIKRDLCLLWEVQHTTNVAFCMSKLVSESLFCFITFGSVSLLPWIIHLIKVKVL